LLATKEANIEFSLPNSSSSAQNRATRLYGNGDPSSKLVAEDNQDALLMIAALSALGRQDAIKVLLPQQQQDPATSSDNSMQLSEPVTSVQEQQRSQFGDSSSTAASQEPYHLNLIKISIVYQ